MSHKKMLADQQGTFATPSQTFSSSDNIRTEGFYQFRLDCLPEVPPFSGTQKVYRSGSSTIYCPPSSTTRNIEKEKKQWSDKLSDTMNNYIKAMKFEKCVPIRDLIESLEKVTDEAGLDSCIERANSVM